MIAQSFIIVVIVVVLNAVVLIVGHVMLVRLVGKKEVLDIAH